MRRWRNVGRAARAAILCFYTVSQEAMYGKVKRLRERGKRMSDQQIASAPFVEGEVRVYGVGSVMEANITDPNSQVGDPLLPTLFEARLTTMQGVSMLLKGEERPQGDVGPAYAQEWAIRFDR